MRKAAAMAQGLFVMSLISILAPAAPLEGQAPAAGLSEWVTGPEGVARMNLVGRDDPSPTEMVTYRERYPAGFMSDSTKISVHQHIGTQHILVLRGTLVLGFGNVVDHAKVERYGPWSFISIPSGTPHYEWSPSELEIQVTAIGRPQIGRVRRGRHIDGPSSSTFVAARGPVNPPESPPAPANGLKEWQRSRAGGSMTLVRSNPPSPTELSAYRSFWEPTVLQDSTNLIYHYHWGTEHVTVIRGTVRLGTGDSVDYGKAHAYGPGSFIEIPAGVPHFEWFQGALEVHVEYVGAQGAIDLDPLTGIPW